MRALTLEIYPQDCVGDSSSKHNYNALSLDTILCNISSNFFKIDNNYTSLFADFSANLQNFINFSNTFYNPYNYIITESTVKQLSSYWNNHEFTVHYPLNISTVGELLCPTINQQDYVLKSLANVFLNENYPPANYNNNTVANVIFFLYSVPVDPNNLSNLQTTVTSPEFSYLVRNMNVSITRQDIFFRNGKNFKFQNNGQGSWIYLKTEAGNQLNEVNNFVVPPTPPITRVITPPTGQTGRITINLTIDTNTFNYDVYANVLNTGLYVGGNTDVILTISEKAYVGSLSPSKPALLVSSAIINASNIGFANGDTVSIINNGNIIGAGGNGGMGQSWSKTISQANDGQPGGDAISLQFPTNIENNGTIAGGGGGGAGGYIGITNQATFDTSNPYQSVKDLYAGGGGGGGAGVVAGSFGSGGFGFNDVNSIINIQNAYINITPVRNLQNENISLIAAGSLNGQSGNAGSTTTGGLGGQSESNAANGGSGGSLGVDGASTGPVEVFAGVMTQYSPKGGTAGNYIKGQSYLNLVAAGTLLGNIV